MPEGVINGQESVLRPVTVTYLQSNRIDQLGTELKAKILDKYREIGNLCEAARFYCVPYSTVRWHQSNDPAFQADVDSVHREFVERAKGYMLQHMARPGNYMDRVTIARRFEPGVWGDQVKHSVEVNVNHVTDAIRKAESIEAEIDGSKDPVEIERTSTP